MPQLFKKVMKPAPESEVDASLKQVAERHDLALTTECRVKNGFAFVDAVAIKRRKIDVSKLGWEFLDCANYSIPVSAVSVTIVLPAVGLSFGEEAELIRRVVAAGGAVARRTSDLSFESFVDQYQRRLDSIKPRVATPKKVAPPAEDSDDSKAVFESYSYSLEERQALRQAYRDEEDSSSVIS